MKGKKILIVEDERPMAHALELKLTRAGFDVTVVFNGEDALKAVDGRQFDLILLDLVMPKMDGFQVLEALKTRNIKAKVFIASNLRQDEDIEKAKKLGAHEYFIKSTTPISLIVDRIKEILEP